MTAEEIKQYLDPYRTLALKIDISCNYEIHFLSEIEYSFIFSCKELGISWDSNGTILEDGYNCNAFELFQECEVNVYELKKEMDGESSLLPDSRSMLKEALQKYNSENNFFYVEFSNQDWREAHEFCDGFDEINVSVTFEDESRFILQWHEASYSIRLENPKGFSKYFHLASVPGKKGYYNFLAIGADVQSSLNEIDRLYSQFGFSFSGIADDIITACENGRTFRCKLRRTSPYRLSAEDSNDILDFNEEHVSPLFTIKYRIIPALTGAVTFVDESGNTDFDSAFANIDEYTESEDSDIDINGIARMSFATAYDKYHDFDEVTGFVKYVRDYVINHSKDARKTFRKIIDQVLALVVYVNEMTLLALALLIDDIVPDEEILKLFEERGFIAQVIKLKELAEKGDAIENREKAMECLKVLGLEESASFDDVKKTYHNLALKFHPDTLASKDLAPELISLAQEQFSKYEEAYEFLSYYFSKQ